ncbi:DM13 domain-containing protein [Calothrix sp. PCC 7507]|uniref:DM13 domain-containing protein n=1 Tax=Calothrix sp. PCC 7507 TaxID=99598 RepID=UPI00029EE00F|nr:DM13 domain-containing protein [Calothrix sp. PCC 7507]AFY33220.1 Electron transfer DM13 [Calothrix sp. PCC 7507]
MKLRYLLILGLSSIAIFSCVQELSSNQSSAAKSLAPSIQLQEPTAIKSGTFASGEHTTKGTVRIINQNGKFLLKLQPSFKTSDSGPDLVIILHRADNVINSTKPPSYPLKRGDYIILAPLQKSSGAQTYLIPDNINLAEYKSAAIWCRKFNATFGAANLI